MSKIIILSDEDHDSLCLAISVYREERGLEESLEWDRLAKLFEKAPSEHTIRVIVRGGTVKHVERLPAGFTYEVQDFDNCSECGELEPYCEYCLEYFHDPKRH